jgi:four helix bundle protein
MEENEGSRRDLQVRTKAFAVRVVRLFVALAKNDAAAQVLGKQALRSGTSVGAQYREACRARSRAEFTSKIDACLQELEETRYWFDLLVESQIIPEKRLKPLMDEARELTAILTASARTAKRVNR